MKSNKIGAELSLPKVCVSSLHSGVMIEPVARVITCASSEARHKFRFAPCFFFYLCRCLQPLDVILDILDSD